MRCRYPLGDQPGRNRVRERPTLASSFVGPFVVRPLVGAPLGEAVLDVVDGRDLFRVLRPAEGRLEVRVVVEVLLRVEVVGRAALGEAGPDVVERRRLLRVVRPAEGGDQVRVRGDVLEGAEVVALLRRFLQLC